MRTSSLVNEISPPVSLPNSFADDLQALYGRVNSGELDTTSAESMITDMLSHGGLPALHAAIEATNGRKLKRTGSLTAREKLLKNAIVTGYLSGDIRVSLGRLLDALEHDKSPSVRSLFATAAAGELVTDAYPDKAFNDLIQNGPSRSLHPEAYARIAGRTGHKIGFRRALAQVPNPADGWFGTVAVRSIVRNWAYEDPVAVSTFLADLDPSSSLRETGVGALVTYLADEGDFDAARVWLDTMPEGDQKQFAQGRLAEEEELLEQGKW